MLQGHFTQSIRYRHKKIGGNSELATSGPENSSEKEMFSVLIGRWWVTMQPVRLTADCSMPVERRQRMIGRPGLIAWQVGQSELLWLTSAGDGGPRRQLPGRYCQRGRTELCRWDSGTSEHRGGTVSALGRATSGDRIIAKLCLSASLAAKCVCDKRDTCRKILDEYKNAVNGYTKHLGEIIYPIKYSKQNATFLYVTIVGLPFASSKVRYPAVFAASSHFISNLPSADECNWVKHALLDI